MKNSFLLIVMLSAGSLAFGQANTVKKQFANEKALQAILDKTVDEKKVFGANFAIKKDSFTWHGASGNITLNQAFFIASTTKLFTTAIILNLRSQGKINLEEKVSKYLDSSILKGLHVYKTHEYSFDLTINHLLSHTSGLPDYFQNKGTNGKSLEHELITGNDQYWTFEQSIARTKAMKPFFAPGTKGKAHYSDANFQLLGKIIESITGKLYSKNCEELIFNPLNLGQTYLYLDSTDRIPKTLYYKTKPFSIPKAMTSFGPDGGIVSTSSDMLVFIEAFFTGKLFPISYLDELQKWNRIFFPMKSGVGIHKFELPRLFNPTGAIPVFIGHSGLSGALAYYSPKENLYIVGTVNQVANPDLSFKTMIKLTQTVLKNIKAR